MALVLRDARAQDTALLLDFVRQLAAYERLADKVRASEALLDAALFGASPRAHALIAEWDGMPAGFAVWCYTFSTFEARGVLFVEDVFVAEPARGRGIGRAIFADLARRTVAGGCTRMEWTVLDWNRTAIDFYRGLGALPVAGWSIQHLGGDALAKLARQG